jgi:PBSX family phage portal protein
MSNRTDGVSLLGNEQSLDKAAETTQLDDRHTGHTVGGGITPPYPPERLAALQELNGTHAIAVGKKASREVGFGFEIVPHPRADDPSEDERQRARDFWHGRDSIWKIGPQGTTSGSPTEVFELARRDWHGIGWLAIELIYGSDDTLRGLAHVPATEVRVRKGETSSGMTTRGHGYVQEEDAKTRYYAEAGDRAGDDPTYVDRETGDVHDSLEAVENDAANELLYIPNPTPLSKYYGIPDWVAEVQTMMADQAAKEFNRDFFEHDAMPQYAVIVEGGTLTESAREDVRELINNLRRKKGRRVPVLEAEELADRGIDVDSSVSIRIEPLTQQGDEDMSFVEFRRLNEHEIGKVHQVPPIELQRTESANRSNSKEQIRTFVKEVIEPRQERFADRLYRIIHQKILDIEDWKIKFVTRGAENEQAEADVLQTIMRAGGAALTVNEARALVNDVVDRDIDPIPELDGELFSSVNDPMLADEIAAAVEGT